MTEDNKKYLEDYTKVSEEYLDYLLNNDTSKQTTSTFRYKGIDFYLHSFCTGIVPQKDLERFIKRYISHLCSHYIDIDTGEHIVPDFLKNNIGEEVDMFLIYHSTVDRCVFMIENELQFDFHPLSQHKLMALKEPKHYIAESFFSFYYAYKIDNLTGVELLEFTGESW